MSIEKINDHGDRAVDRLPQQFKRKPNFGATVRAVADQIQDIEDAAFALFNGRSVFDATAANLDRIGAIVGQARPISGPAATDDDVYRGMILARVIINRTQGEPEPIISLLLLLGANSVHLVEMFPATLLVQFEGTLVTDGPTTRDLLEQATPPIGLDVVKFSSDYFGFAGDPDSLGFGEGELGGVY